MKKKKPPSKPNLDKIFKTLSAIQPVMASDDLYSSILKKIETRKEQLTPPIWKILAAAVLLGLLLTETYLFFYHQQGGLESWQEHFVYIPDNHIYYE